MAAPTPEDLKRVLGLARALDVLREESDWGTFTRVHLSGLHATHPELLALVGTRPWKVLFDDDTAEPTVLVDTHHVRPPRPSRWGGLDTPCRWVWGAAPNVPAGLRRVLADAIEALCEAARRQECSRLLARVVQRDDADLAFAVTGFLQLTGDEWQRLQAALPPGTHLALDPRHPGVVVDCAQE